jgi:hypothetical protein
MALNLDIDKLWFMLGQWQYTRPRSKGQAIDFACAMADIHLGDGHDVIVPNQFQRIATYERFESIAKAHNAVFKEFALIAPVEDAIERCKTRARAQGYESGFRTGGVLDTGGREALLAEYHANVLATVAMRPEVIRIEPVYGDIDGTYRQLLDGINEAV